MAPFSIFTAVKFRVPGRSIKRRCSFAETHQDPLFGGGNQRTGFLVAAIYLDPVGTAIPPRLSIEGVMPLLLHVSSGDVRDVGVMVIAAEIEPL